MFIKEAVSIFCAKKKFGCRNFFISIGVTLGTTVPMMEKDMDRQEATKAREEIISQIQTWLEIPMLLLGMAWLVLFVIELVHGLSPLLRDVGYIIWVIFIVDFLLRLSLSPRKIIFLRGNWLTLLSLLAPAFRVFRMFSALRVARTAGMIRGLRLLRLLTSINRGMKAVGACMKRRGFGYVVLVTVIVTVSGAAAMYSFENNNANGQSLESYSTALWWTSMMMTTMGSQYWPQTDEGRLLCFFLALYSFSIFGYVTATLASFFIGRDADNEEAEVASAKAIASLKEDIAALRAEIASKKPTSEAEKAE